MNYETVPFEYDIPLKRVYYAEGGELVNPINNSNIFKEIITINVTLDTNGIKRHPISGDVRECLANYLYSKSYDDILQDPKTLKKYGVIMKLILRDLYDNCGGFSQSEKPTSTNSIYISNNNGAIYQKEKDIQTINTFIQLLALESSKGYALKLDYDLDTAVNCKFNLQNEASLTLLKSLIVLEVKQWLGDEFETYRGELTNYVINYLIQEGQKPLPTKEYLTSLKMYIDLLSPKVRNDASTRRLLIIIISKVDSILVDVYKHINKTNDSGIKKDRHLVILHFLCALGIISNLESIYKALYDPDLTKSILKDKVKDYMKNKIR